MLLGRKAVNTSTKSVIVASILQACSEVLDRAANLEALLRNNSYPLLNSGDAVDDAVEGVEKYLREEGRLRSLRREVLHAELQIDASLNKIAALRGFALEHLEPLDGYFLSKLDQALSDHNDVTNPSSTAGLRVFGSNYLIKEGKFPYGNLFDEREVRVFFGKMRSALTLLMGELTQ